MRTICQEDRVTQQLARLKIDYARFDDAFLGVNEALCNKPELFPQAAGTKLRRLKLNPFSVSGVPELSIFFHYDDDHVYLVSAELIESEE